MRKKIDVLISIDVDPAPSLNLEDGVRQSVNLLGKYGIKATFFFVANHTSPNMMRLVQEHGHEVGCHGLNHDDQEELHQLSYTKQEKMLSEATILLEKLSGNKIKSFRSPRLKINSDTLQILEKLGYQTDSSLSAQRLDFFSSNLINLKWLIMNRLPYHPDMNTIWKKGSLKILEIPVTAFILPFISTTLRIFGLTFFKIFFWFLYWEAYFTKKPIVYLFHPHEFLYNYTMKFSWELFIPNKSWLIKGAPFRRLFARQLLGPEVYALHDRFFCWLSSKNVHFKTMSEYQLQISLPF